MSETTTTTTTTRELVTVTLPRDVFRRAVLAVAPAASRDDMLTLLTAIRIDVNDDGTVTLAATDRYRLHTVTIGADIMPDQSTHETGSMSLPARELAKIVKPWREPQNMAQPVTVLLQGDDTRATLTSQDGSTNVLLPVIGDYPRYRSLFPPSDQLESPGQSWGMNPYYMADALTAAATLHGETRARGHSPVVIFPREDRTKPVVVEAGSATTHGDSMRVGPRDGLTYRALVMPVRIPAGE